MDVIILISLASGLLVLLVIVGLLKNRKPADEDQAGAQAGVRRNAGPNRPVARRAAAPRNARARLAAAANRAHDSDDEEEVLAEEEDIEFPEFDGKLGAKKRAKLEAKAERQKMREIEEKNREDRKKQQELEDEERLKSAEREKLEEQRRLNEEKKAQEEKERKEHEEYLKMKAMFSVEEEGCEVVEDDEQQNLLQEFISYIKDMKVVVLEDLAAHFKLKTQNVIDRIQELQAEGNLTGVVDDRGKFIYISQEELESVAKFVKQRGRVSITELAESSNQLINLDSSINTAVKTG